VITILHALYVIIILHAYFVRNKIIPRGSPKLNLLEETKLKKKDQNCNKHFFLDFELGGDVDIVLCN
jgi:hypothetical protein